jgi:hypothetical protein
MFGLVSGPPGLMLAPGGATNATLSWATSEANGPSTNQVTATVTDVVNGQAFTRTNTFDLVIREINSPPALTLPADQTIDELTALNVSVVATDPDLPANSLSLRLLDPPAGMTLDPATGMISWTPGESQGPSTHSITVVVTDDNPWASNEQRLSTTNTFAVVVRELNLPPALVVPADQALDEMTPLAVAASATDPDLPANALRFSLSAPPPGVAIDPTTGAITWTPGEAQGPSTNTLFVVVTDSSASAGNATELSVTNGFTVVVREVNAPPSLAVPANQTVAELIELTLSVTATDNDLPANGLTFSVLNAPSGMVLDTATGAIRWTPTEAQGPSTNVLSVVATDSNPFAAAGSLSVTNTFEVIVTEQNTPPSLEPIADQSIHYGQPVTIQAEASDTDLPANLLTYALEGAPEGMTVDATGRILWTPLQSQVGDHTITLTVSDDGSPVGRASRTFSLVVAGEGSRLQITLLTGGLVQINSTGDLGAEYELQVSADLRTWERLISFQLTANPHTHIEQLMPSVPARFYRLVLRQ